MTKMADEEYAKVGLSSSYALVLMLVIDNPGILPKEISRQMQLTPSTVTRLIEKLEYRGLLIRRQNGRCTEVYPTKDGLAIKKEIKDAMKRLYLRYTKILGKEKAHSLTSAIYETTQILE